MPIATTSDQILEPQDPANKTDMLSAIATYSTPANQGRQDHSYLQVQGAGVSSTAFNGTRLVNGNNPNMYQGGGGSGQLIGAVAHNTVGPWGYIYRSDPPLPGGLYEFIDSNAPINAGVAYTSYFPRAVAQQGGNFGYFEAYNPITRVWTVTNASPSGTCVYILNSNPAGADFRGCAITATTQATSDNSQFAATTAFVKAAIAAATPSVTTTGTPSVGQVPTATSGTTATWQTPYTGSGNPIVAPRVTTPVLASGTASNTDSVGEITLTTGSGSQTFTGTYMSRPECFIHDHTTPANDHTNTFVVTNTSITIAGTGTDVIGYGCILRN
jgi:hypothetical protein